MAAVDHDIGAIEARLEEALVGRQLERIRHDARRIGQHPVGGDDGVAFDAGDRSHDPPGGYPLGGVTRRMCSSFSCASRTFEGAPIIRSSACWLSGKAITSRMALTPASS